MFMIVFSAGLFDSAMVYCAALHAENLPSVTDSCSSNAPVVTIDRI
jgi:hypothetical protein